MLDEEPAVAAPAHALYRATAPIPAQGYYRKAGTRNGRVPAPLINPTSSVSTLDADIDATLEQLSHSAFRRRFRLRGKEAEYLRSRGIETVMEHAAGFVAQRLVPADIPNDGKQTPYRNHPVFVAQHATGTCCRGCLAKWHGIPEGHELDAEEQRYVLRVLRRWLERHTRPAE